MVSTFRTFSIGFLLALCLIYSRQQLTYPSINLDQRPPLYLPRIEAVNLFTLGYQKPVADIFWFLTLNYFGEQYQKKASMPWFSNMCDIVSSLDPKARHVYEFCGTLLSWIAKDPESSNKILNKGIHADPTYWKLPYLRGFNEWYFLEDYNKAKKSFKLASSLPDAPLIITSLAAKISSSHGTPQESIDFLTSSLKNTNDAIAKKALEEKLKEAYVTRDIELLKNIISKYTKEKGIAPSSWEQLVNTHYLKHPPKDPDSEIYLIENNGLAVKSRKYGEGLTFKGKTARTGIFKGEDW